MMLQITSPSVGASGATAFTLGDDSAARVLPVALTWAAGAGGGIQDGFMTRQERDVQRTALFRGPYKAIIPRYNLANSLTFIVKRTFATIENCFAFIAIHADSVPALGEITMTNSSATGEVIRYLPNAVLQSCECIKHIGVTCWFRYTFLAPNPWQNSP